METPRPFQPPESANRLFKAVLLFFALLLLAPAALAASSEELFSALEKRLQEANNVTIGAVITASGAVDVRVAGETQLVTGKQLRFGFRGKFMGEQWTAELFSNKTDTRWRTENGFFDGERGPELEQSILLGFTRMGLLHNVATIGSGSPPEHADGGVAEWVKPINFTEVVEEDLKGQATQRFGFEILVDGQQSGTVTLWLDAETGMPARREQTVQFPDGEMKVVEIYRDIVLNAKIITDSAAFKTEY